MFGFYYNSSIRRYVTLLMALFNHIEVQRMDGDKRRLIKVPINYANKEKFVAALNKINMPTSDYDIAKVETILPRMNLTLVDMSYNGQFKTNITNRTLKTVDEAGQIGQFNPVPYTFLFELGIYTRNADDMFQIVEQILPYFQPHFTCKITELYENKIVIKDRDLNIVIQGITPDENADGDVSTRRHIEWTIMFEMNGWLYPNTKLLTSQIKTIYLDFFANSKELGESTDDYESVDFQVVPKDVKKEDWDGSSVKVYSSNTPHNKPPRPQP